MKKTLLATALAVGFASAASAQTSVTLYGRVDVGVGSEQYKYTDSATPANNVKISRSGMFNSHQNGNRWGLTGSEDLGDGLKAIFTLESGFGPLTGNSGQGGRLFGRVAVLGLASDAWGAVKFGRDYNFGGKYMPGVVSSQADAYGLNSVHNTFTSGAGSVRADNLISYESPVVSGFQFGIGYSFNYSGNHEYNFKRGALDAKPGTRLLTTGLKYSDGPLTVAASYDQLSKRKGRWVEVYSATPTAGSPPPAMTSVYVPTPPGTEKNVTSWVLGASYDFDIATLHLGFGQDKEGTISPHGGDVLEELGRPAFSQHILNFKANNYSLGVTVPLASGKVFANWQSSRLGSGVYKTTHVAGGGKSSQSIYTLGYRYDLSPRTSLYATGAHATGYGFQNIKGREVVVGLSHGF